MVGLKQAPTGWYAGLSYDYIAADVSYDATFPMLGNQVSQFEGNAESHLVMANAGIIFPLSPTSWSWNFFVEGGLGVASNHLKNVTEDFFVANGTPDRAIANGSTTSFAYRGSLGFEYYLTDQLSLRLAGAVFDLNDFTTGNKRTLLNGTGSQAIGPYEMDIWGLSSTVGVRYWW